MKPEIKPVPEKSHDEYQYLQLVEQVIENGESKNKIILNSCKKNR